MTRVLLALLLLTAPAAAQTIPEPLSDTVSDYADVLGPEAEARIVDLLVAAREDPGTEVVVVTIGSHRDHGPHPSLESFASGLFDAWGIGDAERNDGILILVAADDRAMRLELGAGYAPAWDFAAEEIVHRTMLPALRAGDLPSGIEDGARAAIDRIARPASADLTPPPGRPGSVLRDAAPIALFLAALGAIFGLAARSAWRRRRNAGPDMGERRDAPGADGDGSAPEVARRDQPDSASSGFGGGSSSGGGASGRW